MSVLEFAQTFFFIVASLALIVMGGALGIIIYHAIHIVRDLRKTAHNLEIASADLGAHIDKTLDRISSLPLISGLLKFVSRGRKKKGNTK